MKYFFKNRKFGDILKTRDGRKVIFIAEYEPRYGDGEYDYVNELTFEGMPHVHELQHALRLFGLNELADNLVIEK